jgi:uncharacterized protein
VTKIVLDTNVIVSAHLTRNSKAEAILKLAEGESVQIYLSPQILEELKTTLLSPKLMRIHKDSPEQVRRSVALLRRFVTLTPGTTEVNAVKDDPEDSKILACAIEGHVDYIVSGDHHLLRLGSFEGIPIVKPATFLGLAGGEP